jgi:hypothetical protein
VPSRGLFFLGRVRRSNNDFVGVRRLTTVAADARRSSPTVSDGHPPLLFRSDSSIVDQVPLISRRGDRGASGIGCWTCVSECAENVGHRRPPSATLRTSLWRQLVGEHGGQRC